MASAPLLLCASPRRGNSLEAARLFAEGFNVARSQEIPELQPTMLSTCNILPCVDCGACGRGQSCPLLERDDSQALLEAFASAPVIAIAAPIYFYHLPAQLKALLDRCQQYYAWKEKGFGGLAKLPPRHVFIMLCAAREQGDQLFSGALLTLKYALRPFNLELARPLTMLGLDQSHDLLARKYYCEALRSYGDRAARILPASGI